MNKTERAKRPPKHLHGRFRAHVASDPHRQLLVEYRADLYEWLMRDAPRYTYKGGRGVDHGGGTGR